MIIHFILQLQQQANWFVPFLWLLDLVSARISLAALRPNCEGGDESNSERM